LTTLPPLLTPLLVLLTHLSKWIPEAGFVNGQDAPSAADCVVLVLTQALIPFGATLGEGAAEVYGAFPAAVALGERVAEYPPVAAWLTHEYYNLKKLGVNRRRCPVVRLTLRGPPSLGTLVEEMASLAEFIPIVTTWPPAAACA